MLDEKTEGIVKQSNLGLLCDRPWEGSSGFASRRARLIVHSLGDYLGCPREVMLPFSRAVQIG